VNAFEHISNELVQARGDARRLEKLNRDLQAARQELVHEQARARELADRLTGEERDVHRLEGHSLRRWLIDLAGRRKDELDRERREAAAAKLQHDVAYNVARGLAGEVARLEAEVMALGDPYVRYQAALAEKERFHTERGDALGQRLLEVAARRADALADRRELDEAIEAGNEVLEHLSGLATTLRRASDFGMWDLIGGGAFVTMTKHGYIDDARSIAAGLQSKLLRFDRELADVAAGGLGVGEVNLGLGWRFADVFLDGILPDFLVQTRIASARDTVDDTAAYVQAMLEWLNSLIDYADNAIRSCDQERAQLLERY
jgi:hypothetical protein